MEHLRYPNESAEYRAARNALLDDEIALQAQIEAVAAKRRALPLGGEVPQDYVFEWIGTTSMPENVKMSELFGPHDTLILYSFMYGPERELPCPGCTHLLDGLDGAARHIGERAALHIVAKSPIARLAAWAHQRGWEHLSLLSTASNRELGRNDLQRFQEEQRRDQARLGLRNELCPTRSETAPSRRRSCRPALGPARHDARRPGRLLSKSDLRLRRADAAPLRPVFPGCVHAK
jgi:predicted dithiol-disulfide oxidoreductase (DUF899 family)